MHPNALSAHATWQPMQPQPFPARRPLRSAPMRRRSRPGVGAPEGTAPEPDASAAGPGGGCGGACRCGACRELRLGSAEPLPGAPSYFRGLTKGCWAKLPSRPRSQAKDLRLDPLRAKLPSRARFGCHLACGVRPWCARSAFEAGRAVSR